MSGTERICVDIDNVVALTDEAIRALICEYTDGEVKLKYNDITTFNYYECSDKLSKDDWDVVHSLFSERDRIVAIRPYPRVQTWLKRLSTRYAIHFATSRQKKARAATIEWLDRNCFEFEYDLHFDRHSEKHVSLGEFRAAVEDDLEQAIAFAKTGVTYSFLLSHPWNKVKKSHARLQRVADWEKLVKKLLALEPGNRS